MAVTRTRRELLTAAVGGGFLLGLSPPPEKPDAEPDVAPAEDLMREHGLLNRVLLVYEEGIRRLESRAPAPASVFASAAEIIRRFIEDYHEKLEEENLFPRFERANRLVELVKVLREQHQAGRTLTATIQRLANPTALAKEPERRALEDSVRRFIRMYRPHEAREDTILFPALHKIVGAKEYEDLGDKFEDRERQLFGVDGFEKMVERVAGLERELQIYDLSKFTPRV